MEETYLGIEIGGTKLQFVSGDRGANISRRWRLTVDPSKGGAGIRQQIESTLAEILPSGSFGGVAVGFGGPVDWRTGEIVRSHQIEGWTGFGLGEWLRSLTKLPVRVDNDANLGALGEAARGAGRDCDPVFYVTLGSGVGGGLVVGGQIYHGGKPGESEIGHIRVDRQGTILESRCSGWAVDARIRAFVKAEPGSMLAQLTRDVKRGEAKFLFPALRQNDRAAQRILEEVAADLAFGLSHVTHLFHPEIIVLGGGLSLLGEPLRVAVANALPCFLMEVFRPGPRIALAALGEDAVPIGALQLACQGE